jgi:exopolysaccharide biosynthesis polyprenyl glycosylphosphotransferase
MGYPANVSTSSSGSEESFGAVGHARPASSVPLSLTAQRRLLIACLVAVDIVALVLASVAAYSVRFGSNLPIFQDVPPDAGLYARVTAAVIALWLGLFALAGLYDGHNLLGGTREYALVFNVCTVSTLMVIIALFMTESVQVSRGLLVLTWLFTFVFVAFGRFFVRRGIYRLRQSGYFLVPTVVVGAGSEGVALADQLSDGAASGMNVLGFIDNVLPVGTPVHHGLNVIGTAEDLSQMVALQRVQILVVATGCVTRERLVDIVQTYGTSPRVDIHFSSGLFEILTTGVRVQERAYVPLISLNKSRLTDLDVVLKNGLDLLLTIPLLIVLAPVLAVIALLIRLDSPGPAIYCRRVLGMGGREFDAYKFRTMRVDWKAKPQTAEVNGQFVNGVKPKDDPRVTRLGRVLRRHSADELPQLWNVLRRQMSLVGPRIITPDEAGFYDKWRMNLLTVRPGLTGLWQVSGRAELSYEDKVRLDMYYIRNYSIWLDLQILIRTASVVLTGKGAY